MNKLYEQLKLHEGIRFRPYRCSAGKLTIGVGRNIDDKPFATDELLVLFSEIPSQKNLMIKLNKGLTLQQVEQILVWDTQDATDDAKALVINFDSLSEQRQFVLIDMAFNMGRRTLSTFRNTLRLIVEGKFEEASVNMLKSKWANQVKGRAKRLAIMLRDDLYFDQVTTEMLRKLG